MRTLLLCFTLSVAATALGRQRNAVGPPKAAHCFVYTNEVIEDMPWSIHIIKIDRDRRDFKFCTTLGKGDVLGMGTVSEQIKSLPSDCGQPLAAINGDFYTKTEKHEGRPRDLQIRFGEVVSSPSGHACFWMSPDGTPQMTNVASRFRVIWADGKTTPLGFNQVREDDAAVLYTSVFGASTRTTGGIDLVLERATNAAWLPLHVGQVYTARVREVRSAGNASLRRDIMVLSLGPNLATRLPAARPGTALRVATEDRLHQTRRLGRARDTHAAIEAMLGAGAFAAWLSGSGPSAAAFVDREDGARIAAALPAGGRTLVLEIDDQGATIS